MIESHLLRDSIESDLDLITDMREALLVFRHRRPNVVGNLGFDGELEVSTLLEPKQLLIIEAPFENRLSNIASVAHQVPEECDDVQERRFPAPVRTNQRSEAADVLFDGFQAAESACLNACKHVSFGGSRLYSPELRRAPPGRLSSLRPERRGTLLDAGIGKSGYDAAPTVIRPH